MVVAQRAHARRKLVAHNTQRRRPSSCIHARLLLLLLSSDGWLLAVVLLGTLLLLLLLLLLHKQLLLLHKQLLLLCGSHWVAAVHFARGVQYRTLTVLGFPSGPSCSPCTACCSCSCPGCFHPLLGLNLLVHGRPTVRPCFVVQRFTFRHALASVLYPVLNLTIPAAIPTFATVRAQVRRRPLAQQAFVRGSHSLGAVKRIFFACCRVRIALFPLTARCLQFIR